MAACDPRAVDAVTDRRDALYLYCLVRRSCASRQAGTLQADFEREHVSSRPADDRPVTLVPFGDVMAVVSVVNRDDFCGPAAEMLMTDLAWVAPRASHHERVVEAVMRTSPVVPARFGTLFSSRERLIAWLATHRVAIAGALDRFADHEEWAMRGSLNRRAAEAALTATAMARTSSPTSPGARYLEERRIRAGIGQDLTVWLRTVREQILEQLFAHAAAFRERAVSAGASEGVGAPVFNWAFLVPSARVTSFRACVQRIGAVHAEHGLALHQSGPWPPYSFSPELASERGDDVPGGGSS
ncbi:MAG: GvpL/GvpF family gas vesicle protein [Acidobacteria bacterium]|nr:GvpL/GvpF family gas vesicle protein [Acidobacteriota bacterium]